MSINSKINVFNQLLCQVKDLETQVASLQKQLYNLKNAQTPSASSGEQVTDYVFNITGAINGVNRVYQTRFSFQLNTTKVYWDGLRLTPGVNYDYIEIDENNIQFTYPPDTDSNIIIEYIKL